MIEHASTSDGRLEFSIDEGDNFKPFGVATILVREPADWGAKPIGFIRADTLAKLVDDGTLVIEPWPKDPSGLLSDQETK